MIDAPLNAVSAAIRGLLGGAHAPLPPSSADRWVPCPGSIYLSTLCPPEEEGEPAREGTAAHWAACELAAGRMVAEGQVTPEGWVLDADQIDGAELWAQHLPPRVMALAHLEQRLHMRGPRIHIHEHNWGTADLWSVDVETRNAWIDDYKYGHGLVKPDTLQLVNYAAGVVNAVPVIGPGWKFHLTVVQPRVWHRDGHVRTWHTTYEELEPMWTSMAWAAEEATSADPRLQTGEHCEHCPARYICPALHNDVSRISTRLEKAAPLELPDNALGFELRQLYRMKALLDARIDGLEVDATSRIRSGGRSIPWFTLNSKPGRKNWKFPDRVIVDLAKLSGYDIAKDVKAATPTQAVKMGVPEAVVDALSARSPTALKLEVVDLQEIRREFIDKSLN